MSERRVEKIEVVDMNTSEVVHAVDCHGQSEWSANKVERGMLINMNREQYFTRMVYLEELEEAEEPEFTGNPAFLARNQRRMEN